MSALRMFFNLKSFSMVDFPLIKQFDFFDPISNNFYFSTFKKSEHLIIQKNLIDRIYAYYKQKLFDSEKNNNEQIECEMYLNQIVKIKDAIDHYNSKNKTLIPTTTKFTTH